MTSTIIPIAALKIYYAQTYCLIKLKVKIGHNKNTKRIFFRTIGVNYFKHSYSNNMCFKNIVRVPNTQFLLLCGAVNDNN